MKESFKKLLDTLKQENMERLAERIDSFIELGDSQIETLAKRMVYLPWKYEHILYLRYGFSHSWEEIRQITALEDPEKELLFAEYVLATSLGLEGKSIAPQSMEKAVKKALQMEELQIEPIPNRNKKKILPFPSFAPLSKVACFVIVLGVMMTGILNEGSFGKRGLISWIIERKETYSDFDFSEAWEKRMRSGDYEYEILRPDQLEATYIPDGYELYKTIDNNSNFIVVYEYKNIKNQIIGIHFVRIKGTSSALDTRGADVETFEMYGEEAYRWVKKNKGYIMWIQDGVMCHVYGEASMEELMKMAESVQKK
ncbi:MAG: DUF4367 domain-containing protein [Tissierellia bacterium]|nr:DUF4367 domain-containing protein [Tissierellia bacterium]